MATVLDVEDVVQEYPGVRALKGVSLSVDKGVVLGIVGENGAGKSTLIRILGGIERPTEGKIRIDGEDAQFRNASESQRAGIAVVSQEFRLVSELSVADSIFLGREITRHGVIDTRETRKRSRDLLDSLGLALDPGRSIASLTIGDRQLVEIARALSQDANVVIMDEPTATLNETEIARLHGLIRELAHQHKAIIYVSHHLDEVFQICDRVVVLRDGNLVADKDTADLTEPELVEYMLGHRPDAFVREQSGNQSSDVVMEARDVQIGVMQAPFDITLHRGEIVGLAGLVGSGRTEISRALFGDIPMVSGELRMKGKPVKIRGIKDAMKHGVFMLSEDRKGEGILPHLDVIENMMVARIPRRLPGISRFFPVAREENEKFDELRQEMHIRVSSGKQLIGNLSGGNQQKVLMGRALLSNCQVLILNEPTRGVDVGAKTEIYHLIQEVADSGVAVVVSSSDAPELETICDRCLVYFAGKQIAELTGAQVTQDNIIRAAVGQGKAQNVDE